MEEKKKRYAKRDKSFFLKVHNTSVFPLQEALAQVEAQTQDLSQPQKAHPPELAPRLCHMARSEKGYGFNLHSTRLRPGQYIRSFDPGSPAELAGLRRQDRVIEVPPSVSTK